MRRKAGGKRKRSGLVPQERIFVELERSERRCRYTRDASAVHAGSLLGSWYREEKPGASQ